MIETRRSLWRRRIIVGSDVCGLDHAVVVAGNGGGGKGWRMPLLISSLAGRSLAVANEPLRSNCVDSVAIVLASYYLHDATSVNYPLAGRHAD